MANTNVLHTHTHTSHTHTHTHMQFRVISIIAEGIPENKTKQLIKRAKEKGVVIIGPATVRVTFSLCLLGSQSGGPHDNQIVFPQAIQLRH